MVPIKGSQTRVVKAFAIAWLGLILVGIGISPLLMISRPAQAKALPGAVAAVQPASFSFNNLPQPLQVITATPAVVTPTVDLEAIRDRIRQYHATLPPGNISVEELEAIILKRVKQYQGALLRPRVTTPTLERPSDLFSGAPFPSPTQRILEPAPTLPAWIVALQKLENEAPVSGHVVITKSATAIQVITNGMLLNPQMIYTLTIRNTSDTENATNITVADVPPEDTLVDDVECDNCTPDAQIRTVLVPGGLAFPNPVTISFTELITWNIPSLAAGMVATKILTITVPCKPEGAILNNQAFINFDQGSGISNQTQTAVPVFSNEAGLVEQPSWCSETERNVFNLDWGDFNRDGDLDLVLASTGGTIVFRNEDGELKEFWDHTRPAFDARWGDFDNDGDLDIVSIGDGNIPGTNYIHYFESDSFTTESFVSVDGPGFRVEPANFDGDLDLELAISHNLFVGCGVRLYQKSGMSFSDAQCLQQSQTSAGLAAGDYDNDGDLDLALNQFSFFPEFPEMKVLINGTIGNPGWTGLDATEFITFDTQSSINAYGMTWGDYDRDGDLDLAISFPRSSPDPTHLVQIHENMNGNSFAHLQTINAFLWDIISFFFQGWGPHSVDWADINPDGQLKLLTTDGFLEVYRFDKDNFDNNTPPFFIQDDLILNDLELTSEGAIWQARGADQDSDGDLDVSLSGASHPSQVYPNNGSFLMASQFSPMMDPNFPQANSVAWGDTDRDGDLDLLFGAGVGSVGAKLYENDRREFAVDQNFISSGFGPHAVAFGDVDQDGQLDAAIATGARTQLYLNGDSVSPIWEYFSSANSLAWADADLDNDGRLELLVGNDGQNMLFLNSNLLTPGSEPVWSSIETDDTRSIAWGYFDDDFFLDFVAGNYGQPNRVYRNNGDLTFSVIWTAPMTLNTRSVAWGDVDNDGDLDLAVGNYGQANQLYVKQGGTLVLVEEWALTPIPTDDPTTSVAWGDWNNDGRLDLAVGNYGEKDVVYHSRQGPLGLSGVKLWESAEQNNTTGVAWGDMDNDGDLDLAISQDGGGADQSSGIYENFYVSPSHLTDNFSRMMPLVNNPSYVSIIRPGQTADADLFSAGEFLGTVTPEALVIPIRFRVYDPDGSRNEAVGNALGDRIAKVEYEYSLDGGGIWQTATTQMVNFNDRGYRLGHSNNPPGYWTVNWDAGTDLDDVTEVVDDAVRFRITVIHGKSAGLAQRAKTSAVSPQFRVRRLSCTWPDQATITVSPPISSEIPIQFEGNVSAADGQVTFNWDWGDNAGGTGIFTQGQVIHHTYAELGTYTVTLRVKGPACPTTRDAIATTVVVLNQTGLKKVYLPLVLKTNNNSQSVPTITSAPGEPEGQVLRLSFAPGAPDQVVGLGGQVQNGGTALGWQPNPGEDQVLGYRVYRATVGQLPYRLLAELAGEVSGYRDETGACGQMYVVTAYNEAGESAPSSSSYFSPPCR